jgi:hypothetical protein
MQATENTKLTARDFTYVYEPGIGRTYQNGPYLILCERESYSVAYKGQTFSWDLTDFLSAIEHCQRHDAARRSSQDVLENAVLLGIAKLERRTGVRVTHRAQEDK